MFTTQRHYFFVYPLLSCLLMFFSAHAAPPSLVKGSAWKQHTIDRSSQGADGVRLADVTWDGRLDLVTPWEEGGLIRVYFHPGPELVRQAWPHVTVGEVAAPEDAMFVDLDQDGAVDVLSCTEGKNRTVYVHWAPKSPEDYRKSEAWRSEAIPATKRRKRWMFALADQLDGRYGPDILIGSKNTEAELGWLEAPEEARDLAAWRYHRIRKSGWMMSLLHDPNDSGWWFTDRMGAQRGCYRLLLHGNDPTQEKAWRCDYMGGANHEVMFMAPPEPPLNTALIATKDNGLLAFPQEKEQEPWRIPLPGDTGTGKAVAVGDLDGDARPEIILSCEHAEKKHGLFYWRFTKGQWRAHAVSGLRGTKFDLIQLIDLDADGDLDILSCEERENLGVIWYENEGRID